MDFEEYFHHRAREAVLTLPDALAGDIYVVSFYFWAWDDDPRKFMLTVSYNTNTRWRACAPAPGQPPRWPIASDEGEAKWNYAFWLQEEASPACVIGERAADARARRTWLKSLGLWWTDQEKEQDFARTLDLGGEVERRFVALCSATAKRLHEEGVIRGKFGRPVPIIVHETEYSNEVEAATARANPPGLAEEFRQWFKGG